MQVHARHAASALLIARAQTGAAHSILGAIRRADREARRYKECCWEARQGRVELSREARVEVRRAYCVPAQIVLARQATIRDVHDTVYVPLAPETCPDRNASPLPAPWRQPLPPRQITHAQRPLVKKYLCTSDTHQKGAMIDVFC